MSTLPVTVGEVRSEQMAAKAPWGWSLGSLSCLVVAMVGMEMRAGDVGLAYGA